MKVQTTHTGSYTGVIADPEVGVPAVFPDAGGGV